MLKIVIFAIIAGLLILTLKNINSEFYQIAIIASGLVLSISIIDYFMATFTFIQNFVNLSGIDAPIYKIVLKAVGIGYLVEFSSSTLEDFGLNSLAKKVVFAGNITIISLSLPIINSLFSIIGEFINL